MEIDETDKVVNKQQRKFDKFDKRKYDNEQYNGMDIELRTKIKSKESLSPIAKSEDLVDEELANMEQTESLDALSTNVRNTILIGEINALHITI